MAETTLQNRPSTSERNVTRRPEYSADPFGGSPFAMMRRLSEDMNRAFDNIFGMSGNGGSSFWSPAIEVRERNGNLEIVAELPGLSKEDVKVESTEEGIVIEGEKRREQEENREGFHRSERSYGRFCRVVPLPKGAQVEKATAEFKDGMLEVGVPIPENTQQQRRKIPVAA